MKQVQVIGGGLAGLAAALTLAEAGQAVILHEAGPAAGGRCRSYFDRTLGCRIDNGNHLLLSGNAAALAYLDRLGTRATLGGPAEPCFPFLDRRNGARWVLRPNRGRLPWWVASRARRVPESRMRDYLALLALRRVSAETPVAAVLGRTALYSRLFEPLAIAALNTPPAMASAALFAAVVNETLMRGGAACIPAFPRAGLSESFIDPAIERLRAMGGEVRLNSRIAGLRVADGRVAGLLTPAGEIALDADAAVVLAVPAPVAAGLLPGLAVPDAFEAIVNVHVRLDAEPGEAGFTGLIGGVAEWVFVKPGIVSVTISAANRLLDMPAEAIAEAVWPDIRAACALAEGAALPAWRVVKEKRATFAATPAQDRRRPGTRGTLANLALAGDWTATGLPATIEGAIRSGNAAAMALLAGI